MEEIIEEKDLTTGSNIAFVMGNGKDTVSYGTLVDLTTSENYYSGRAREERLNLVWKFDSGKLGFVDVTKFFQCGKVRMLEAEDVDFSTISFYYTVQARDLEKMMVKLLEDN